MTLSQKTLAVLFSALLFNSVSASHHAKKEGHHDAAAHSEKSAEMDKKEGDVASSEEEGKKEHDGMKEKHVEDEGMTDDSMSDIPSDTSKSEGDHQKEVHGHHDSSHKKEEKK